MRFSLVLPVLVLLAVVAADVAAQTPKLKEGDPAPPLTVTEWIKGGPEDLASGKGKKIYVLDFWATWCLPCLQEIPVLTELQKKYADNGVVIIGFTGPGMDNRQRLSEVKKFVKSQGDQMGYTIAWDQTNQMDLNYMAAAGAIGIPHTFVVDKSGRVAWQGHPRGGLEEALKEMIAGTFDIEKQVAMRQVDAQLGQLLVQFQLAMRARDHRKAISVLDSALDLDPTVETVLWAVFQVHNNELNDPAAYRAWVEAFIDKHRTNADAMVAICRTLLSIESPEDRLPDLALVAARAALDAAPKDDDASALAVNAQVCHRLGRLDDSIRFMGLAIEHAPEHRKAALTKTLDYYRTCARLRDSEF